jgi:dTDP-glucose pyrophosphorylase/CBS domain-containing protein
MSMKKERHIISEHETMLTALSKLNDLSGGAMTLFVVDDNGRMCGSLTDGDVRRALIEGHTTDEEVGKVMHRNFKAITGQNSDNTSVAKIRSMRQFGITLVPRLDAENRIIDIVDLSKTHTILPLSAILMAGGKGERLRPLTLTKPKPLLEIDGKAIIDYNIEALVACGITDITVSTRYLAEQLYEHFSAPICGVQVKCITEEQPLGTIGAVALIEREKSGNTLVMNSDLLTTISFEDMYLRHQSEDADITIAAIPYQVSVPFAILSTEGHQVKNIEEKPSYSYFANAGIYIFKNSVLETLRSDVRTDATDLIESTISKGGRVVYYPINGTWLDVGSHADFAQAQELMRHHRNLSSF